MATMFLAVLLFFVPAVIPMSSTTTRSMSSKPPPATCARGYEDMIPKSTMCLHDSTKVVRYGVTDDDKQLIVRIHNELRAKVDPPAKDLTKLEWDDSLAEVAAKWARHCEMEHDENRDQPNFPGIKIGQNMAGGQWNWTGALYGWFNEYKDYQYGKNYTEYLGKGGFELIGHYTQFVSCDATRVGCGFAYCRNTRWRRYYVCNYAGLQRNITHPYSNGTRCSACPKTCNNGLCDCNGMVCYNHGKLDPDSCTCSCLSKLYINKDCSELACPAKDVEFCGDRYPESYCIFNNVKDQCPYMCGICNNSSRKICGGKWCENHGELDWGNCQCMCKEDLTGDTCETKIEPCNGKKCQNGGRLDEEDTCDCHCRGGYTGENCEIAPEPDELSGQMICSFDEPVVEEKLSSAACNASNYGNHGHDALYCQSKGGSSLTCEDCITWHNVPTQYCPVMCGVCEPPCNDKYCKHGGELDPITCECTCPPMYRGVECEIKNCPTQGAWYCKYFPLEYCDLYHGVPETCPYLCGICATH